MTVIIIHCFVYECYLFIYYVYYTTLCLAIMSAHICAVYSSPYSTVSLELLHTNSLLNNYYSVRIHNYCMLIYKIKNIIHNNHTHESLETLHTTFSQYIREYSEKSYKLSQGNGCRLLLLV